MLRKLTHSPCIYENDAYHARMCRSSLVNVFGNNKMSSMIGRVAIGVDEADDSMQVAV
jgi:hypothetical protein